MDTSTAAAIAALMIACAALLIATAQVLQQYFQTGQLIRLCDSVVFGPLPGKGHRVWVPSQFRFKIVYSVPQISLPAHFWPTAPPHTPSFTTGVIHLPPLQNQSSSQDLKIKDYRLSEEVELRQRVSSSRKGVSVHRARHPSDPYHAVSERDFVGEASWVSFCRAVEPSCGSSIRLDMITGDADRCPADLPTVPMQVSMRDVVAMALSAGMECTYASFKDQSLFMQGKIGSITSSNHPILGPLLHFTPRWPFINLSNSPYGRLKRKSIKEPWLGRTWGNCTVNRAVFNGGQRRTIQRLDERWMTYTERLAKGDVAPTTTSSRKHHHGRPTSNRPSRDAEPARKDLRRPQDGKWRMRSKSHERTSKSSPHYQYATASRPSRDGTNQADRMSNHLYSQSSTVPDSKMEAMGAEGAINPNQELHSRIIVAQKLQAIRSARVKQVVNDSKIIQNLVNNGSLSSPYHGGARLLTQSGENPIPSRLENKSPDPITAEEEKAHERESERMRARKARDEGRRSRKKRYEEDYKLTRMQYFWLSQMDIFEGHWATEWQHDLANLDSHSTAGAISVIFEAMLGFLGEGSIMYFGPMSLLSSTYNDTATYIERGGYSCPSYAHNARGGVVADGVYLTAKINAFKDEVPVLELLYSYDWQVDTKGHNASETCRHQNIELIRLDSWLSITGRMEEIASGNGRLLKQTPAIVELLMGEFGNEWKSIDRSANEGGLQDIQALTSNVMDWLTDEDLSDAEQLFVLVAVLRTLKVAQLCREGADTSILIEVILKDVQAHLV